MHMDRVRLQEEPTSHTWQSNTVTFLTFGEQPGLLLSQDKIVWEVHVDLILQFQWLNCMTCLKKLSKK